MKEIIQASSPTEGNHLLVNNITTRRIIFLLVLVLCASPLISPPLALLLGIGIAWFIGHPYPHLNQKATHILLQVSIVGLGFGMNIHSALKAGKEGILFTVVSIVSTLVTGFVLGKLLRVEKKTAYLISAGTAICGGSAIAAITPVIQPGEKQVSVALGTVFILNAVALFLFPVIGHAFNLSSNQFGMWCAIAIHDTSAVTGAAGKYSTQALEVATTVKLARALWIIPVALFSAWLFKTPATKVKIPYFIGLFVVAMVTNTYVPGINIISQPVVMLAKSGLTLTLFLIGCGLSRHALQSVGWRPLLQGVVLWGLIAGVTLWTVMHVVV